MGIFRTNTVFLILLFALCGSSVEGMEKEVPIIRIDGPEIEHLSEYLLFKEHIAQLCAAQAELFSASCDLIKNKDVANCDKWAGAHRSFSCVQRKCAQILLRFADRDNTGRALSSIKVMFENSLEQPQSFVQALGPVLCLARKFFNIPQEIATPPARLQHDRSPDGSGDEAGPPPSAE